MKSVFVCLMLFNLPALVVLEGGTISDVQTSINLLKSTIQELEKQLSTLAACESNLQKATSTPLPQNYQSIVSRFYHHMTYNNHTYYVSGLDEIFRNISVSIDTCKLLGGYLVVIGDVGEYEAIKAFVATLPIVSRVIISGTDEGHEGTWLLQSTNQPLPYENWESQGQTGGTFGTTLNCLLISPPSWKMSNFYCNPDTDDGYRRYMCEVPNV